MNWLNKWRKPKQPRRIERAKVRIRGAGVAYVDPMELLLSEEFRRQSRECSRIFKKLQERDREQARQQAIARKQRPPL